MEFPIEMIEAIPSVVKTVTKSVDIAKWLSNEYQQRRKSYNSDKTQDSEGMDSCFLKTLYILRQESENKKLEVIKRLAQKTILSGSCELDTGTILHLLSDIEQMTWRQICFIEGIRRIHSNQINIKGVGDSQVDSVSRTREMDVLTQLGYLYHRTDDLFNYVPLQLDRIYISEMGSQFTQLLDLSSIPTEEIAKAFGPGQVSETVNY